MNQSSMLKFWTILLAFLFPGVDDPDPAADPAGGDPDPDPAANADPDPELQDPEPAAPAVPASPAPSSTDELAALRESNRALQAALTQVAGGNRPAPAPTDDERLLANPDATPEQKWQAQANIALRAGYSNSQQALQMARDSADAASYQLKCVSDPLARKYMNDVEKKRQEFVAKNQIPPDRDAILTWVIGEKVRNRGVAASAAKPAKSPTPPATPRGSTPNARSDVGPKGKTESQKRRERLENMQI